ncbi:MAG: right-handed parallel beta-helix repeat-containing protein, partial [Thermoplasmata archaeon]|nr:right-handed parallel beta-helix repeat-containing protein [Thermoplasmata archaeon]
MSPLRRSLLFASAVMLTLVAIGLAGSSLAQTDPPALGDGDWTVRDTTVMRDWDVIMLRGDLLVTDGGELTLINSTLLFVNADAGEHGVTVDNGGTLKILGGATVGSSRPNVAITFVVEAGCSLEIRDSFIEEVGPPSYGIRPKWREIAMYIGTSDAVIENSTFTGGLVGPFFDEGVMAPPVRNCTFENVYGIISYGIGIEDCTFRNQNIYGIVFHGGDTGYVARCTFESV